MDSKLLISSSSSSSSLGPLAPSRLLQLPDELLDEIFRFAYEGKDAPSSRPVSRRLWPHQERQLCRRVRLVSVSALESFSEVLRRQPSYTRVVTVLHVELGDAALDWDWDATVVASTHLGSIVPQLERLQELRVADVGELIDAVFAGGPNTLVKLRRFELVLTLTMFYRTGVSGRDWFEKLGRLPALEHIKLEADCTYGNAFFRWREPHFALPRLTSLHLWSITGEFSSWHMPNMSAVIPNLIELELSGLKSRASVDEVLRVVPVGIRKLVLCDLVKDDEYSYVPGAELVTPRRLTYFTRLERVEFGGFTFDDDLLPTLARLPHLRHLIFRLDADVTVEMIHALGTAHRPPALELVTLDHVPDGRGPSFLDNGLQWDERARSTEGHVLPGWTEPDWPLESFGPALSAAIRALERAGVVVEGTALGAVGWDRAHATESFLGTMLMCIYDDCMSAMERAWGEVEAAAALRDFDYARWLRFYAGTALDDRSPAELDADEDRWY